MKKIVSVFVVLCLLLAVCPMALAELGEPAWTLDGYYTALAGSNVLILHGQDSTDICALDGTVLKHFDSSDITVTDGVNCLPIADRSTDLRGLVGLDGKDIIPVEYDQVNAGDVWAVGIKYAPGTDEDYDAKLYTPDGLVPVIVEKADLYNMKSAECVASMDREAYVSWDSSGEYVNIQDRKGEIHCYDGSFQEVDADPEYVYDFRYAGTTCMEIEDEETWLYALGDAEGNPLTEAVFGYIYLTYGNDDYIEVENEDGMMGLISKTGETVVPMEYEEILKAMTSWGVPDVYETAGIFAASNGDVVTMIDTVNGTSVDVDCSEADEMEFLGTCLRLEMDGKTFLVGMDGEQKAFPENVEDVDCWVMPYGTYFVAYENDYSSEYLFNDELEELIQSFDVNELTADGHVLVYEDGVTSIYDLK